MIKELHFFFFEVHLINNDGESSQESQLPQDIPLTTFKVKLYEACNLAF